MIERKLSRGRNLCKAVFYPELRIDEGFVGQSFTRDDARQLALGAMEFLVEEEAKTGKREVLLIGGSRHGERRAVLTDQKELSFPTALTSFTHTFSPGGVARYAKYSADVYYRADYGLPMVVFEHSSLRSANKTRQAKELDEDLARKKEAYGKAKKHAIAAQDEQLKAQSRRDQFTRDYGI